VDEPRSMRQKTTQEQPQTTSVEPDDSLLECLIAIPKETDRRKLVKDLKADMSLNEWKKKADEDKEGFYWYDGLLKKTVCDDLEESCQQLVVPAGYRQQL